MLSIAVRVQVEQTNLSVPDWWQIPEPGATAEQIKAILKENLQKAGELSAVTGSGQIRPGAFS